jgi:hypothetical protein
MRDVVYFHGHSSAHALLVRIWPVVGATVVVTVKILRARARPATTSPRGC